MNEPIILRRGERIRPEEFPPEYMEVLNRNLDAIRDERYPVSEAIERVLSIRAVSTALWIIGAALIGFAAFHTGVQ
jgi:hypothetical protein